MTSLFPVFVPRRDTPQTSVQGAQSDRGKILCIEPSTRLRDIQLPAKLFACVGVFEISNKDESLTDSHFQRFKQDSQVADRLRDIIGSSSPSLSNLHLHQCDPAIIGKDKTVWGASLGGGHFSVSRTGERYSYSDYKLCLYSPNKTVSTELKNLAAEMVQINPDCTVKEFLDTPEFSQARILAERNICRSAERIATQLGVTLAGGRLDDRFAIRVSRDLPLASMPKPVSLTFFGTLTEAKVEHEKGISEQVIVADRMSSLLENVGNPFIPLGPLNGIASIPLKRKLSARYVEKSELENLAIPAGPALSPDQPKSVRDKAYIGDVCMWAPGASPKSISAPSNRPYEMLSLVESNHSAQAARYTHIITYVS